MPCLIQNASTFSLSESHPIFFLKRGSHSLSLRACNLLFATFTRIMAFAMSCSFFCNETFKIICDS
uniref:Putative ovule protein n=1 Tax=Solanum chacoense TaxID=4108 RepID=A0A0V0GW56_SOLCH